MPWPNQAPIVAGYPATNEGRSDQGVARKARCAPCYSASMASHGNLADPDYEPTDEELRELVHSAFAGVVSRNAEALRVVHAEIAALRADLVLRFAERSRAESAE